MWHWWLGTKWQRHRHPSKDVHPLLARLDAALGHGWMTTEHVTLVLDAPDATALVERWLVSRRPAVHYGRRCAYPECLERVASVNGKYCEMHAGIRKREAKRAYQRRAREKAHIIHPQSGKSDLQNSASGGKFVRRPEGGR